MSLTRLIKIKQLSSLAISLILVSQTINAAEPIFNPNTIDPGVIGKSISNAPSPYEVTPASGFTPKVAEPAVINPEAAKIFFTLNKIEFTGNTVFNNQQLEAVFQPYLHRKISVAELQKLVQSVTDKYQTAGYFLSKALLPPQEIKNGLVKVTVVEGFISQVDVQGLKRNDLIRFIGKYGTNIQKSKPIKLADLERYLLLMNDIPGFSVKSVLAPDPKVPLGSVLTLVTELTPFEASLTQDNFQTRYLGPDETSAFASLNSLFIPGGRLYAHVINADSNRKLQFYELRHDQTIGTHGLVLSVDGYSTKTNPQFILQPLQLFGTSDDLNVVLTYPLIRSRQRSLSVLGQFDYMNNASSALGEKLFEDRIRDATVALSYNDTLWKGEDMFNLTLDKGFKILNAGGPGFRSRAGADMSFFKTMATFSRNQFLTDKISIYALVTAQTSNAILPAAETFIFGGPYLGRGYDWAQFTGDKGVAGKAEFRITTAPNYKFLQQVQYYAFYDAGKLWNLIPNLPPTSGASAGFGARAMIMKHLNAEGFFGRPLTTPNATEVILGNSGHAFLGYFQVSAYL